jgi:hypothetical protein
VIYSAHGPNLYTLNDRPGLWRACGVAPPPNSGEWVHCHFSGRKYGKVYRDIGLERNCARALKRDFVPDTDWYVCDCGDWTRRIVVLPDGTNTCPTCEVRARGRVASAAFAQTPSASFPS